MLFEIEYHQKIITVLESLNADFFHEIGAYFGGGTLLALLYGEYRWSKDIDFICPVGEGYRKLRSNMANQGYDALFKNRSSINLPREFKADQYGIRFAVVLDQMLIKFEIIAEGRISLDKPSLYDWCPVPCLNFADSCSEKLLANADRWADSAIKSRDLIDLATLRQQSDIPVKAYDKAGLAYPVVPPLIKSVTHFQTNPNYRKECYDVLQIKSQRKILDGIDLLANDHGISPIDRTITESIS
ncbi:MAG: nucleotidyl transferase AbiEii/AbiGii toxin family protein [Methylococcaceae bacterium]